MKYILEYRSVLPPHWKTDTPDVYPNVYDGFTAETEANSYIEWVDNETFNKVITTPYPPNNAPPECYRLRNPDMSRNLAPCAYYTIIEKIPVSGSEPNVKNVGWICKYRLNYKMTFLGQWIEAQQVILNARTKRCSYSEWSPNGRIPDSRIQEALKDTYSPSMYIYGSTPKQFNFERKDGGNMNLPVIMYYVYTDKGKVWLIPELLEGRYLTNTGTRVTFKNTPILNTALYCNRTENIESVMSKNANGFLGKFFGPNLNMLNDEYNATNKEDFISIEGDTNISIAPIFGVRYRHNMFISNYFTISLPDVKTVQNSYHIPPSYEEEEEEPSQQKYTYEHLEHMTLKVFDNVFDLPIMNWTKPSNYGETVYFVVRIPGLIVKPDGIFALIDQYKDLVNGFPSEERYITYEDPNNSTFHYSSQLPTIVDTYKQWANDNLTSLTNQYYLKQQSTVLNGVLSGLASIVGIVGSIFSGGATLPLAAAGVGGLAGVIKSASTVNQNKINIINTVEQAKQKYKGNILSGSGISFSYYNYYLGNINNQNNYGHNATPLTYNYLSKEQKKIIDYIYYWYGRAKIDVIEILDLTMIKEGWNFLYFELDYEDDVLTSFFNTVVVAISQTNIVATPFETIYSYLLNFVKNGVRIWRSLEGNVKNLENKKTS